MKGHKQKKSKNQQNGVTVFLGQICGEKLRNMSGKE
jgi:hypothetical protein